jgi:hypothetical protein
MVVADVHERGVLRQEAVALLSPIHVSVQYSSSGMFGGPAGKHAVRGWQACEKEAVEDGGLLTGWMASAPRLMAAAMMLGMFR